MTIEILNAMCRDSLDAFAMRAFEIVEPGVYYEYNWHIGAICEHLEASFRGELPRLIINLPPRCLKSFLVARVYPAWVLGKEPTHKFISTSYGYEVAEQNSMACRRIMKDEWYKQCFPETIINPDLDRNTHFETTRAGQYYAASALSPLTGLGASTILIDDPLKPMEAYSEAIRTSTNQNIRTTMFSRFNDKRTGKLILIMQRLHEDDTTGNLLKDGGYHLLKLPAEAKTHVHIQIGDKSWDMKEGDLLLPSRLSREILDQTMLDMTPANYAGQYLQEPVPLGGGEFRPEWYQHYPNGSVKPKTMNVYILVDAAGGDETNKKKKKSSDRTAMAVVGLGTDNNYYLLDMVIDRLNATERIDTLFILHHKWNDLCGKPPKVGYEKYGLMTDTHYAKKRMDEEGYRFQLIELGGRMAKEERIRLLIPDMQKGRWYFPDTLLYTDSEGRTLDLVKELLESEMAIFPRARYDDGLDALSRVYSEDMAAVFPRIVVKKLYTEPEGKIETAWTNW
jgi:predicted phage terminase large subunit-like protein